MKSIIARRWMFVPLVLLAGNVIFAFVAVRLALSDHGTAAEPDAYRRALAWDESHAARTAGERLRWTISPSLTQAEDGEMALELAIADKWSIPIDGAAVSVELIPVRAADLAVTRTCASIGEGIYGTRFPARISGQWEFRVRVERGSDRLEESFRRMIARTVPRVAAESAPMREMAKR